MESQPQNSEFRNNPENFHPCAQKDFLIGPMIPILKFEAVNMST